jgi:hypothetical protein
VWPSINPVNVWELPYWAWHKYVHWRVEQLKKQQQSQEGTLRAV